MGPNADQTCVDLVGGFMMIGLVGWGAAFMAHTAIRDAKRLRRVGFASVAVLFGLIFVLVMPLIVIALVRADFAVRPEPVVSVGLRHVCVWGLFFALFLFIGVGCFWKREYVAGIFVLWWCLTLLVPALAGNYLYVK